MKVSALARFSFGLAVAMLSAGFARGAGATPNPPDGGYHLLKTILVATGAGWRQYTNYSFSGRRGTPRVCVARRGGRGAECRRLFSGRKNQQVQRCHGVALAPKLGKGFITDGDSREGATVQEVVIFDLKTLKVTGRVSTGQVDTDAIISDPASGLVFTFNGDSHNSTVIDPVKQSVITNIDLIGKVEFPAVDGKGILYDNNPEKNDIVAIDTRTNTVKSRWPTAPAGAPTSMAMDVKNRRLFSAGRGPQFVIMMNADTGKVIQSYPISEGVDANAFDPSTGMLFVATRVGMLHIYHEDSPDKLSEVESVKTGGGQTLQVDPKTHNVFLSTSDFNPPAAPTEKQPHPLATAKPGNFRVLVYGK